MKTTRIIVLISFVLLFFSLILSVFRYIKTHAKTSLVNQTEIGVFKKDNLQFNYPKSWFAFTGDNTSTSTLAYVANYDLMESADRAYDPSIDNDKVKIKFSYNTNYENVFTWLAFKQIEVDPVTNQKLIISNLKNHQQNNLDAISFLVEDSTTKQPIYFWVSNTPKDKQILIVECGLNCTGYQDSFKALTDSISFSM